MTEPVVQVVQRRGVLGLAVVDQRYPPHHRHGPHEHDQGHLTVVVAGRYLEVSGRRQRHCTASSIVVRPAGESHATTIDHSLVRCLRIELSDAWLADQGLTHALDSPSRDVGLVRPGESSRRLFRHFAANNDLADAAFALELATLLHVADEPRGSWPRWLDNVLDRLRATFLEPVRVAHLAHLTDVSPIHLGRLFRSHTGSTIPGFVLRLRTEFACGLLLESDAPLSEVAWQARFTDQSHLSRAVVRLTGVTPARYRREAGHRRGQRKWIQDN